MKSFALVAALASVALAQNTSSLIPTGISSGCGSFLSTLNNDASLSSCTTPLISATSSIVAGNTTSTSGISSTLNNVCGSAVQCDETAIRKQLSSFWSSCNAELSSNPNSDVLALYDALYAIVPLKKAVCSKDDSGAYCATSSAASGSTPLSSFYNKVQSVFKLNTATFQSSNAAFLFLKSTLDSTKLCTSCTRSIITSYIQFEANSPYGPGIGASPLLGGQTDLYKGVQSTCGQSFLTGAVQAAGSLSDGVISSNGAAPHAHMGGLAAIVGAAGVVAAFAL